MENDKLPRGIRNNNPLNIRLSWRNKWKGQTPPSPSPTGATGGFRAATECGCSPTKGSKSPLATGFGRGEAAFCQFESMKWGIRAAYVLIHNYIHIYGLHTIQAVVTRWAPVVDRNDPDSYAARVRELMEKSSVNYRLDFSNGADMVRLVYAMAIVENGTRISYHAIMEGYAMACADMNIEPHLGGIDSYVYEDMDVTQAAMQHDFEKYRKEYEDPPTSVATG